MAHYEREISEQVFADLRQGSQRAVMCLGVGFSDGDTVTLNEVNTLLVPTGDYLETQVNHAFMGLGVLTGYSMLSIDVTDVHEEEN